jgi:hypothetical protein
MFKSISEGGTSHQVEPQFILKGKWYSSFAVYSEKSNESQVNHFFVGLCDDEASTKIPTSLFTNIAVSPCSEYVLWRTFKI